jgi:hypothetical protein
METVTGAGDGNRTQVRHLGRYLKSLMLLGCIETAEPKVAASVNCSPPQPSAAAPYLDGRPTNGRLIAYTTHRP